MKRKLLLIVLSIACIFCLSFGLAACAGNDSGGGDDIPTVTSGKRYNDKITYKLLYTSEDECPDGNIDNEKLHTSIKFEVRKVYYMAVDFTISSFKAEGWEQNFTALFKVARSESVGVKLEEASTSNFSEKVEDDNTIITTTYSIPENRTEPRTYRIIIRLFFQYTKDYVTTYFAFYGNNQSNYKYDEKLILLRESTEGLTFNLLDNEQGYEVSWNNISETDIYIPDFYNELPVIRIKDSGFKERTSIKNIFIPDTVTAIGNQAFYSCTGLNSVTIPSSVTSIGDGAFFDCYNLKAVYIKDIESWCNISFSNDIDTNPLNYAHKLYLNNKLVTELIIPDSITSISDFSFYYCTGLTSVIIPDGVTSIGDGAFSRCSGLTSVTIPDSVTEISGGAFEDCTSLESITIGSGVTAISDTMFYGCKSLASVTFGEGSQLMTIEDSAFNGCSSLKSITIPNSVTSIGNQAFYKCTSLTWILIPNSVTSIGDSAFYYCTGLVQIVIPDSVTSIGSGAFNICTNLISVIFENMEGWWVSQDITATSGENISSIDLDYPGTAAWYLRSTFCKYYWRRT